MGQSGSTPMVLNRGTEKEIEVEGFKRDGRRRALTAVAVILTGGLFLLFMMVFWKRRLRVVLTHRPCELTSADTVFIQETRRNQETTLTRMSKMDTPTSGESVLYFNYKKARFVWDEGTFSFSAQTPFDAQSMTTKALADKGSIGLTKDQVERNRRYYGDNRLTIDARPLWEIIADEAFNPFYFFQLYAAAIWYIQSNYEFATAILLTSIFSIGFTAWETKKQIACLKERVRCDEAAVVVRDGRQATVPSSDLVPGDVLVLPARGPAGSSVSVPVTCDAVLLAGDASVNEAMLTGESVPVTKMALTPDDGEIFQYDAHRQHVLLSGTEIVRIRGTDNKGAGDVRNPRALVVRTGFMTLKGEFIRSVLYPEGLDVEFFKRYLQMLPLFLAVGAAAMAYTGYTWSKYGAPTWKVVIYCLDILTFAVPSVLPIMLTSIRASAQRRLRNMDIFCLSTSHIPVAGAVDLFCFDKTGTLTENQLGFAGALPVAGDECQSLTADLTSLPSDGAFAVGVATCHAVAVIDGRLVGNATDLCVFSSLNWELEQGYEMKLVDGDGVVSVLSVARPRDGAEGQQDVAVVRLVPFDPVEQCTKVVVKRSYLDRCEVFVKGAADKVLNAYCDSSTIPEELPGYLAWYEHQGYRALAVARKELPSTLSLREASTMPIGSAGDGLFKGSSLVGIILLENVLKDQAPDVLDTMRLAGIENVMVTGDSLLTALSVARKSNLVDPNVKILVVWAELVGSTLQAVQHVKIEYLDPEATPNEVAKELRKDGTLNTLKNYVFALEGRSFDMLREHEPDLFLKVVHRGRVFARMLPQQKERLVRTLRQLGRVVGMCGDGCNDIGALRAANVGLSLSATAPSSNSAEGYASQGSAAAAQIAAPFSVGSPRVPKGRDMDDDMAEDLSGPVDLDAVVSLILEGRSTLCSYVGATIYILALSYSALLFVTMVFSTRQEPSDSQYVYADFGLVMVPGLTYAVIGPAAFVTRRAPPRSIMHPLPMFSLLSFLAWQAVTYVAAWRHYRRQPWYIPYGGEPFTSVESVESTTLFYAACWSYIAGCAVFSHGIPYRQPIVYNRIFTFWVLGSAVVTAYFTISPPGPVAKWLHLVQYPHFEFNVILLLLGLINVCVSFLWEIFVVQELFGNHLLPKLMRQVKLRCSWACLPHEEIERDLTSRPDWPPVGIIPPHPPADVTTADDDDDDDDGNPNNGLTMTTLLTSSAPAHAHAHAARSSFTRDNDDGVEDLLDATDFGGERRRQGGADWRLGVGTGVTSGFLTRSGQARNRKPNQLPLQPNSSARPNNLSYNGTSQGADSSPDYAEIGSPVGGNPLTMHGPAAAEAVAQQQKQGQQQGSNERHAEQQQQQQPPYWSSLLRAGSFRTFKRTGMSVKERKMDGGRGDDKQGRSAATAAAGEDEPVDGRPGGHPAASPLTTEFIPMKQLDAEESMDEVPNKSAAVDGHDDQETSSFATVRKRPSFIFTHEDIQGTLTPISPRSSSIGRWSPAGPELEAMACYDSLESALSAEKQQQQFRLGPAPPKPQRRGSPKIDLAPPPSASDPRRIPRSSDNLQAPADPTASKRSSAVSRASSNHSDKFDENFGSNEDFGFPHFNDGRGGGGGVGDDDDDDVAGGRQRRTFVKPDDFYS